MSKMKISVERQRKIGFVVSILQIMISTLSGLLFTPFLISSLGQDEYGLYQLLFSTIGYIATLDLGLGGTITRYVIKYDAEGDVENRKSVIGMCIKLYSVLSLIAFVAVIVVTPFLDKMFISTITGENLAHARLLFVIMGVSACISLFDHAFTGILTAYEKYIVTKGLRAVKDIARIFILVVLFVLGFDALAIVCVDFIAMVIIIVTDMISCRISTPIKSFKGKFCKPLFREIVIFSMFVFMQVIISQVNASLSRIVLGRYSTLLLVGMYGVAMQIYNMASSLGGVFGGLTLPMITRCVCMEKNDRIVTDSCIKYSRIQCYILLPILSGFFLFGRHFIGIWMEDQYDVGQLWGVILLILTPNILEWIETPIFNVMKAKNKQAIRSMLLFIVMLFNLFLTVYLVKGGSVYGAALGTAISCFIGNNILSNIYYHKKIGVNMFQYFFGTFKGILPVWLATIIIGVFINKIPGIGAVSFIVKVILYVILYICGIFFFAANNDEKNLVYAQIKKFIKK